MPVHPARRPRPVLAALVAGALLACAYLMWGPAHTTMTMAMTEPMPGMTASAMTASAMASEAAPSEAAPSETDRQPRHAADIAPDECPAMSMDCPLANAHPPLPVAPASVPGTDGLGAPPVPAEPLGAVAVDDRCAWPRAPDPVALLCVSRT
ncbi:hypothetical protein RCO28_15455 [Streptomyces sp. LHD-70]|uniref:hypothetical protein n=1 Tax=Streptomyces sp. LHD-70 TaxID=3072140 RepID=UPI00280DE8B4|nr:hypothetical protein [Streptomyces sp. LHD-70]MDQ8703878.1 hypothetical protein [Streptomyces sp. LHD-70]